MLSVDIWQNGLMALGYYQYIGPTAGEANGGRWDARDPAVHAAVATGIVLGIARFSFQSSFYCHYLSIPLPERQPGYYQLDHRLCVH